MRSNTHICNDVQEQFDLCELGLEQLDTTAKKQMESHIEECDGCKKWLSEWELVKLETHQMQQLEVPTSVLANIMSAIEPAPVSTPSLIRSDLVLVAAGLALLMFGSIQYGAEGIGGTLSWCLSFAILLVAHQLLNVKVPELERA